MLDVMTENPYHSPALDRAPARISGWQPVYGVGAMAFWGLIAGTRLGAKFGALGGIGVSLMVLWWGRIGTVRLLNDGGRAMTENTLVLALATGVIGGALAGALSGATMGPVLGAMAGALAKRAPIQGTLATPALSALAGGAIGLTGGGAVAGQLSVLLAMAAAMGAVTGAVAGLRLGRLLTELAWRDAGGATDRSPVGSE